MIISILSVMLIVSTIGLITSIRESIKLQENGKA